MFSGQNPSSRMNGNVSAQIFRHFEALRANCAHMLFLVAMHRFLMACQCRCGHKAIRTIFAFELTNALVAIQMDFQAVTGIIAFVAHLALIVFLFQMHRTMVFGEIVA